MFPSIHECMCVCMYGRLGGMMPTAGGDFDYLRRAFGDRAAFSFAWYNFFVGKSGSQAIIATMSGQHSLVWQCPLMVCMCECVNAASAGICLRCCRWTRPSSPPASGKAAAAAAAVGAGAVAGRRVRWRRRPPSR